MNVFLQNGLSQVSLEDFDTSPCKTFMNALILRGMTVAPTLKRGLTGTQSHAAGTGEAIFNVAPQEVARKKKGKDITGTFSYLVDTSPEAPDEREGSRGPEPSSIKAKHGCEMPYTPLNPMLDNAHRGPSSFALAHGGRKASTIPRYNRSLNVALNAIRNEALRE